MGHTPCHGQRKYTVAGGSMGLALCAWYIICVMYVKGLDETNMTLDRRLPPLLRLVKNKTVQAGNFNNVEIFNAKVQFAAEIL